jgi:hypothetical protein
LFDPKQRSSRHSANEGSGRAQDGSEGGESAQKRQVAGRTGQIGAVREEEGIQEGNSTDESGLGIKAILNGCVMDRNDQLAGRGIGPQNFTGAGIAGAIILVVAGIFLGAVVAEVLQRAGKAKPRAQQENPEGNNEKQYSVHDWANLGHVRVKSNPVTTNQE